MLDWIYNIPIIYSYISFIALVMLFSLFGLFVIKNINLENIKCDGHNAIIAIMIGVMGVFLGVMMGFLINTSWSIYKDAKEDSQKEAQLLYILYGIVNTLPNTEDIKLQIITYLEYLIRVEFPNISGGNVPMVGETPLLERIQKSIFDYNPQDEKETVLYQQAIDTINMAINFRINRLILSGESINGIIIIVAFIDSIAIIIMSWFLSCVKLFHYLVVIIIVIFVASSLFIVLILSNPFRGSNGLNSLPFETALGNILKYPA